MPYNTNHSAIKRLMGELKQIKKYPDDDVDAHPVSTTNMFEWHFTIRGPSDSPYEMGIYHGKIYLPHEYPFKPPDIVFLTPNGRFETGKKICLSMTSYHPESWEPCWNIKTALTAIRAFFSNDENGVGALRLKEEERLVLAKDSIKWKCESCKKANGEILSPLTDSDSELDSESDATLTDSELEWIKNRKAIEPDMGAYVKITFIDKKEKVKKNDDEDDDDEEEEEEEERRKFFIPGSELGTNLNTILNPPSTTTNTVDSSLPKDTPSTTSSPVPTTPQLTIDIRGKSKLQQMIVPSSRATIFCVYIYNFILLLVCALAIAVLMDILVYQ
mmetsp:Transcript_14/g.25  ORF Transcript_14/g.25 Transcript_14/m.25 type:complete len:330 (-) Transcript_14:45-1034(-)|eukprot:CAMPEP_0117425808 /NCGR_PEP_ID=MMETSP0758-20121206/6038_1 /TAXON_ID=63605 /ORGANISM="Percolomonas cosmopolitus, Strain AE-1 (ATCC 50343)" /LENGTH=329 /DNA_ID=CAMNT_0005210579 /DNA_START=112 /DNA_END=1101 /DNA_ORIENTATION=+